MDVSCLDSFSPIIREWFLQNIGEPSMPQKLGWPEIASGRNVLVCAPTGSGKTFAAFLKCLDLLYRTKLPGVKNSGVRIVYISPLKALNNDIYRNLDVPVAGIRNMAWQKGYELPDVDIAIRTGDTPQKERTRMVKNPPDILITTPESLFIMLTSKSSRHIFSTVEYVIIDEIHSICTNKRGVHLSLTLERLEKTAGRPLKRIGLTATINPITEAAFFLAGNRVEKDKGGKISVARREISIINCDQKRKIDLFVNIPVKDFKARPESTIWPSIYSQVLTLIRSNKSTLVFTNNRRHAEMVAAGVNSLADEPFLKTHHGSISKEIRQELEKQFKEGNITCLVATSSLELGIDIGSIDMVIQIGAPDSSAQVLQRIGRSGHKVGASSKGCIIPRTRGELLNAAFISSEARKHSIESTRVPSNCLDVLAQQITSICSEGEWNISDVYELILGAYPYRDLPYKQFEDVVNMLSDPSPVNEPGSIKPRIMYDRSTGVINGTPLGRGLCLREGGTIPDKGDYTVYLKDTNIKLGELQEEFVFESRIGERFFLGSSAWRLEAIEKDRVLVSPTTQSGAKIPFWQGDKTYRTYESGLRFGIFLQKLQEKLDADDYFEWMAETCGFDRTAAENLKQLMKDQIGCTGYIHSDKLIVCEYFSDEVGDRRIIIHTPFGGKIHAGLAIVLHSRLTKLLNCAIEYIHNNDGILFHILGYTGKLGNLFSLLTRESVENEIIERLPKAPLFNINIRYNLTRALLVNKGGYLKRKPAWIQRLRSAEVLESVLKMPNHPIINETYRECLNDILDINNLCAIIDDISRGRIKVIDTVAAKPSPFTSELLFNFWQVYQYAYELPMAERRNQLLSTDRDFIQLASGTGGEYELIDERAVKAVEKDLHTYKFSRKIKSEDDLYYFIYSFGEIRADPYICTELKELEGETCFQFLKNIESQGRIVRIGINNSGELYWIASEDYPLYCKLLGLNSHMQPVRIGVPGEEIEITAGEWLNSYILSIDTGEQEAAIRVLRRYLRFRGPFSIDDITSRYSISSSIIERAVESLVDSGEIIVLKESVNPGEKIFCQRKVYERIKNKTQTLARKDIKPKSIAAYCSFLFEYQGIVEGVLKEEDKLSSVIKKMQGMFLPAAWWEDFLFPCRIKNYNPQMLDYLCASGVVKWVARINKSTPEVAFYLQEDFEEDYRSESSVLELGTFEKDAFGLLKEKGALFLKDYSKLMNTTPAELLEKLEAMVWAGMIVNDSFTVIRYYLDNMKKNSPWLKYNTYPNMGRWSVIETGLKDKNLKDLERCINRLMDRYGVISKDIISCEKINYKWAEIYRYLRDREYNSDIKRGFFIEGLSGIQFTRNSELEMLRMKDTSDSVETFVTICACDIANPYRDLSGKAKEFRITKDPGTAIVFRNGIPALTAKGYGKIIVPLSENMDIVEKALDCFIEAFRAKTFWTARKNISVEFWGDEENRITDVPIYEKMLEKGFDGGYNGASLWRKV